jgi:hypothetical protein
VHVPVQATAKLMRHIYQALCLVFLLLAGQHGAVVHELGHLSGSHGVSVAPDDSTDTTCALCPSFAQVASPAFSHSFVVPLPFRVEIERLLEPRAERADASVPAPRSRGPPSLS